MTRRPKTVLMTVDTVGGVWTYALELAAALAPYDVRVHLATMGPAMRPEQRAAVAASTVAGVHESEFALEWMPDPWDGVDRAGDWLLGLADELRPDVVHLNGYAHAALPWPAPTVVVAHSCVLSWWSVVHAAPAPAAWSSYRERVAAGLAAATAVVAPTQAMLDEVGRCYGVPGGRVIPNCRDDEWVRDDRKEPLVVGSGRVWDEGKNLALLVDAAPRLRWPVIVAGDPRRPDGAAPPAGAEATLAGPVPWPELAELLLRASIYVAPSRYEPFGLGALEAAQAGCALVLGDIASLREVWGDAALYVAPGDLDGLVSVVDRLAGDDTLRATMGTRARQRAGSYSPARTAAGYVDLYDRLPVPAGGRR